MEMVRRPQLEQTARMVLDTMEGRSLGGVSREVEQQRGDLEELGDRVNVTSDNLHNLAKQVETSPSPKSMGKGTHTQVDTNDPAWLDILCDHVGSAANQDQLMEFAHRLGMETHQVRGWMRTESDNPVRTLLHKYVKEKTREKHSDANIQRQVADALRLLGRREAAKLVLNAPAVRSIPPAHADTGYSSTGQCQGCQQLQQRLSACEDTERTLIAKAQKKDKEMVALREELDHVRTSHEKFMDVVTNKFQDSWNRVVAENKKISRQVDTLKQELEQLKIAGEPSSETFL